MKNAKRRRRRAERMADSFNLTLQEAVSNFTRLKKSTEQLLQVPTNELRMQSTLTLTLTLTFVFAFSSRRIGINIDMDICICK